jgi:hypothetical protein
MEPPSVDSRVLRVTALGVMARTPRAVIRVAALGVMASPRVDSRVRRVMAPRRVDSRVLRVTARAIAGLVVIAALASPAAAHPLDLGYLRVRQAETTVAVTLDLDAGAAAILLQKPALDAAAARAGAATLASATYAAAPITSAAGSCTWGPATAVLVARTVTISSTATCPGTGERRWEFPFVLDHRISTKFELLVKEVVGDSERLTLVDPSKTEIVLATASEPGAARTSRMVWVVLSVLGLAAFCAILLRWRRRTTSTT